MAFDPKCLELAAYFLPSGMPNERPLHSLAQHIQTSVEEWLDIERERLTQALTPPEHLS